MVFGYFGFLELGGSGRNLVSGPNRVENGDPVDLNPVRAPSPLEGVLGPKRAIAGAQRKKKDPGKKK